MPDNDLTALKKPYERFEEIISVRGCKISLSQVKEAYKELNLINRGFGESVVNDLTPDPKLTAEEWQAHKDFLLKDAFALTVTIDGLGDQRMTDDDISIFDSADLPHPVKTIFFTNVTAFKRHSSGGDPMNRFHVLLDFSKPELLDPKPLVSQATSNDSNVMIAANDVGYFRAVQRVVNYKITNRKTWYGFLHKNFSYDLGLWFFALPVALYFATIYMDQWLPIGSELASFRWAFFIYAVGIILLLYRFLSSYVKWAFPVNVLEENKDTAFRHRVILGGIVTFLVASIGGTLYELLIG